jgi:PPK2 family polyphosphate:nucleotide phosphotransferase
MTDTNELTPNRYRVHPGSTIDLDTWDPDSKVGFDEGKKEGRAALKVLTGRIAGLQRVMWAEDRHKLLVVIQAMDTGGKDGTIRSVFGGVNPQGIHVANFKVPTPEEMAHDYLWRIQQHTPGNGEISIFNRSHYEDVLVVRVLGLVPEERWRRRFDHIRAFEQRLADEGTTILKFYLNISKAEQKERLQARLDDPSKNWKFNTGDLDVRAQWDDYMAAYEDVLSLTSTDVAPWYIVPANRKWYRNLVIAKTIVETLESKNMAYPEAEDDLTGIVID